MDCSFRELDLPEIPDAVFKFASKLDYPEPLGSDFPKDVYNRAESMVSRGQANQSNQFDTPGNIPFRYRYRTRSSKTTKSSQTPFVSTEQAPPLEEQPQPPLSEIPSPEILPVLVEPAVVLEQVKLTLLKIALPNPKVWRWPVICLGALGLFGGISISAYLWLAGLPPLPDCKTITPLSADGHRLYCAQEAARSGKLEDLKAGITLVQSWSPNHPLYRDAQAALTKWSKLVLLTARDRMNQNDFKGATEAINQIPKSSSVYPEAQETLAAWQKEWQKGEKLYAEATEAIKQQDWSSAFGYVTELGSVDHDYWRLQQADLLSNQILTQKESQEALKQAQKLAKKLAPEQLGEAIELLQTVAPNTEAWTLAQQLSTEWSQFLSKTALQYWQDGNPSLARELAQQIPLNLELTPEAKDLVKFSHAQKLVEDSFIESKLSWKQVWSLLEATTAAKQIQPNSPVYNEAQAKLQDWQAQLQDLQQLQFANWVADWGQKPALEYAIAEAQQIPPDRLRYAQAQSLVSDWKNQIQRLEDFPFLQRAQQFAVTPTVENLQLAIAQAQVIPPTRSIWAETQAQIIAWQDQIEKIEDQPMFDRAQMLAKANKLDEAIATAAEIQPDRSLYGDAQAAIATWKEKQRAILIAEDQVFLTKARQYAAQSQLTDAIAAAAEITPGRPLYLEAQAAIGDWLRERDGALKTEDADSAIEPATDFSAESGSDPGITSNSSPDAATSNFSQEIPVETVE